MSTPPTRARSSLLATAAGIAAAGPDAAPLLVDCRFDLLRPEAGREAFLAGHVPGARYAHLDHDLSGPRTPGSGRHPLPDAARFTATCQRLGIGPGSAVVAYDDGSGAFAARLWWLLRWFGHANVRLLDGGLAAWRSAGLPLESGDSAPQLPGAPFVPGPPLERVVVATDLERGPAGPVTRLLDARAAERYAGTVEPIDAVAGHVPGARNWPFATALATDQTFLPADEIRRRLAPVLEGATPAAVAVMCGSGVTACHGLFSLALAGHGGAALYAGSWSEWIQDPARPVARGSG